MRQSRDLTETFEARNVGLSRAEPRAPVTMSRRAVLATLVTLPLGTHWEAANQQSGRPLLLIDGWVLRADDRKRLPIA